MADTALELVGQAVHGGDAEQGTELSEDLEEIHAEARRAFEDIDWGEIRRDIETAQAEIETLDLEGVRADVLEALEDVDWDEIRRALEDAQGTAAEELEAFYEVLEELGVGGSGVI